MLRAEPTASTVVERAERPTWPETVLVALALLVLLTSYRGVIDGWSWFVTTTLVVALVTVAIVVLRLIGVRRLTTPIALIVELVVLGWVFAPSTLLLIVLPTPATFEALGGLVDRAATMIMNEASPVASARPIVLTVAAAFGALVVLADILLRTRFAAAAVGVLLLAVFVTPAMISGSSASPWLFAAVAALWLIVLRSRTAIGSPSRRVRQVPAILIGLGGLAGSLLFPVVSPDIGAVAASWGHAPPQVFGRGINPMIELGTNLRRGSTTTVLTYTTDLNEPPYLKVATLTDFTGKTWKPVDDYRFARFEGRLLIDDAIDVSEQKTQISIDRLRSTLVPAPYPATAINGFDGAVRWERTGQTLQAVSGDTRDQTYTITSLQTEPTADQLRNADPNVPYDIEPFTGMTLTYQDDGRRVDATDAYNAIARVADEVSSGQRTVYDRVMALQNYLRSTGGFRYSETAPVRDDYDGNGLEVLATFLDKKSGYCVHFSSAMAVMARSLGIPARIAVGYAPGSRGRFVDGEPVYTVTSDNLHAWTEIWFNGIGWVRFDPTPTRGEASTFVETGSSATPGDDADPESPSSAREREEEAQAQAAPDLLDEVQRDDAPVERTAAAVGLGLLLVLGAPWAARSGRRRWRLRPSGVAEARWREVQDTARDLGLDTPATDTPRGFAERLRSRPGVDDAALDRLLGVVEHTRYARHAPSGTAVDDARQVCASLTGSAPRRERWRARLLPRSLVRWT